MWSYPYELPSDEEVIMSIFKGTDELFKEFSEDKGIKGKHGARLFSATPNMIRTEGAATDLSKEDCSVERTSSSSQSRGVSISESRVPRLDHDRSGFTNYSRNAFTPKNWMEHGYNLFADREATNRRTPFGQIGRVTDAVESGTSERTDFPSSQRRRIIESIGTLPSKGTSMAAAIFGRYPVPDSGSNDSGRSGYQSWGIDLPVQDLYERAERKHNQFGDPRPKNLRTPFGRLERVIDGVSQGVCSSSESRGSYPVSDSGLKDSGRSGYQSCGFDCSVQDLYEEPIVDFSGCGSSTVCNGQSLGARPKSRKGMSTQSSLACGSEGTECGYIVGSGQNFHDVAEDTFHGLKSVPCPHQIHRECALHMIQKGLPFCHCCWMPLFETPAL